MSLPSQMFGPRWAERATSDNGKRQPTLARGRLRILKLDGSNGTHAAPRGDRETRRRVPACGAGGGRVRRFDMSLLASKTERLVQGFGCPPGGSETAAGPRAVVSAGLVDGCVPRPSWNKLADMRHDDAVRHLRGFGGKAGGQQRSAIPRRGSTKARLTGRLSHPGLGAGQFKAGRDPAAMFGKVFRGKKCECRRSTVPGRDRAPV